MTFLEQFSTKVKNLIKRDSKEIRISAKEAIQLLEDIEELKTKLKQCEILLEQAKANKTTTNVVLDGQKF